MENFAKEESKKRSEERKERKKKIKRKRKVTRHGIMRFNIIIILGRIK